ncbi:MAG: 2-dehydro-3-deoxygalactonokinase [Alphaproteobacteria bacterium]
MTIALIALDWGTTSLRAYALSASGAILDARSSAEGILAIADRGFEATLRQVTKDWLQPEIPVIASGMITSRQGWVETGYVDCPADAAALVSGLKHERLSDGVTVTFVPGARMIGGIGDVMRGEETQLLGLDGDGLCVLPGTHSKWAVLEARRISRFASFMTGEVFAALLDHTILGRLAEGRDHDATVFRAAVLEVASASAAGLLTHAIFGARTRVLGAALDPRAVASHLSGLMIGAEIAGARQLFDHGATKPLVVVGSPVLTARYREAFEALGLTAAAAPEDAAARGLFRLAMQAGLV